MSPNPPPAVPEVDQDWDLRVKRELERRNDKPDVPSRWGDGTASGEMDGGKVRP